MWGVDDDGAGLGCDGLSHFGHVRPKGARGEGHAHHHATGKLLGPNCHGAEKVHRLQDWLAKHTAPEQDVVLHAYGDTRGDWPMLAMAQRAWYRGRPWVKPL
ncbi:MAG: hypothetical protein EB072_15905 [Betaproteobacteria bacterium]|nr:hypothetical protein [Betaproteobacteria bacterium]